MLSRSRARTSDRPANSPLFFESLEMRQLFGIDPFSMGDTRAVFATPDTIHTYATADVDGDGDADLVASAGPRIHTLLNNGNGRFVPTNVFRITGIATQLVLADFDGDGDNDLAALGRGEGTDKLLRVFTSDRDGTWTRKSTIKLNAEQILPGNFDTDTRQELAAIFLHTATIYQMNAGIPNAPRGLASAGFNIADAAIQDMNADGISDVVLGLNNNNPMTPSAVISIWLVSAASTSIFTLGNYNNAVVDSVSAVDILGNARPDVLFAGRNLSGTNNGYHGIWALAQTTTPGNPLSFSTNPTDVRTFAPSKLDLGTTQTISFDVLGARNIDNLPGRDVVTRVRVVTTDTTTDPDDVTVATYLALDRNDNDGTFTHDIGAYTNPGGDDRFGPVVSPFQVSSPAYPDLMFVQRSIVEGGLNKIRYAENQYNLFPV